MPFTLRAESEGILAAQVGNPVGPEFVSSLAVIRQTGARHFILLFPRATSKMKFHAQTSETYDLNICQSLSPYLQLLNPPPPRPFLRIASGGSYKV